MKALVLGSGKSGKAAAELLRAQGFEVETTEGYDLVVVSPGLPVKSELQVGCEVLRRRGVRLLAVTGSKGKSSVVKVVAEALVLAGFRAVACGNYGLPVSEVADCDWAVVEVSSFMLETTSLPPDTFEAAAILNLQEDHLDRHGSVEAYHALKRRLLTMTRNSVGAADAACASLFAGTYFDNDVLRANGLTAVSLMRAAGLDDAVIRRAFVEFEPLPHRMNVVAEQNGVRYVDDSKATSLAALAAGVTMAGEAVRLIAGGQAKGDDPKFVLPTLTKRVKKVYLIGACAEEFGKVWREAVNCEVCGDLATAVANAKREAEKGETVLLSPGTASFDQFKSFGERGDVFASLVKKGKRE